MTRRRLATATLLVVSAVAAAACGGDDGAASSVVVPRVFDVAHDPAAGVAPVDPTRSDVAPAAAVRALLEQHLAVHGVTLAQAMRAARAGDAAAIATWVDALTANTDDLTATVGLVYGPVGARAFHQQWAQHTQFLVDLAVGVADGDDDAVDEARARLATYAADSGGFFETATGGALPREAVHDLLDTHVGHMVAMIDAEHRGDPAGALDAALVDNAYLAQIALGLATAVTGQHPDAFPGALDAPASLACTIRIVDTSADVLDALFAAPVTPEGAADAVGRIAAAAAG